MAIHPKMIVKVDDKSNSNQEGAMELLIDIVKVADTVKNHRSLAGKGKATTIKLQGVDDTGDVVMTNADGTTPHHQLCLEAFLLLLSNFRNSLTDLNTFVFALSLECDRSCCVRGPHHALLVPEVLTAILEHLEDDPQSLRSAMCVSRAWAPVSLAIFMRICVSNMDEFVHVPADHQPLFAARLRSFTIRLRCCALDLSDVAAAATTTTITAPAITTAAVTESPATTSAPVITTTTAAVGTGAAAAAAAITAAADAEYDAHAFEHYPPSACAVLHSPRIAFPQLRQLDVTLTTLAPHAALFAAFLARCGRRLARVRVTATSPLPGYFWAAALAQLAWRRQLVQLQLCERWPGLGTEDQLAVLGGTLERSMQLQSTGSALIAPSSSNSTGRSGDSPRPFAGLRTLEIAPVVPNGVARLLGPKGWWSNLTKLMLTVHVPTIFDNDDDHDDDDDSNSSSNSSGSGSGDDGDDISCAAVLPVLANLRFLRDLRVQFCGHVRLTVDSIVALHSLARLETLSLAPADNEWRGQNRLALAATEAPSAAAGTPATVAVGPAGTAAAAASSAGAAPPPALPLQPVTQRARYMPPASLVFLLSHLQRLRALELLIEDCVAPSALRLLGEACRGLVQLAVHGAFEPEALHEAPAPVFPELQELRFVSPLYSARGQWALRPRR